MDIVITPDNPAPPGANVARIRAVDGVGLRVARWHPQGPSRGTVAIAQGRAEFIEKYFETVAALLQRDLTVVAFDWRGQGLSDRELDNSRRGHIDDFALYERDLDAVRDQTLTPFCPQPWFALGHSMGAAALLRQARAGRSPFARLVLTAPLIQLHGLRYPVGARWLAKTLDLIGLGESFVPGGGETAMMTRPFANNVLTSDAQRHARNAAVIAAAPYLAIGDPTIGWLDAAFEQMDAFADPEFARRTLTPTLVFAAGEDRVTDTRAIARFGARLKAGRVIVLPGARHDILTERDSVREQFWAAFDAFVPGSTAEAETGAAANGAAR